MREIRGLRERLIEKYRPNWGEQRVRIGRIEKYLIYQNK